MLQLALIFLVVILIFDPFNYFFLFFGSFNFNPFSSNSNKLIRRQTVTQMRGKKKEETGDFAHLFIFE
jgi:hypothetical protein